MIDLQVSVADVDVSTGVKVVGELQAIGSVAGSSIGAPEGDEVRLMGCPKMA